MCGWTSRTTRSGSSAVDDALRQLRQNIMYTLGFFIPKVFVESNSANYVASDDEAPTFLACTVARRCTPWWRACDSKDGEVKVDAIFLSIMRDIPGRLQDRCMRPCTATSGREGRSRQARGTTEVCHSVAGRLYSESIHSTMWIWRSYSKVGTSTAEWGFELVRNPGHDADGNLMPN